MQSPVGNIDLNPVAFRHQGNDAAVRRFRRYMADGQAGGAAGESPIRDQGADFAQPFGFQVAGRIEHFLHARPAPRPFVTDQHDIAWLNSPANNRRNRIFLTFNHARRPLELENVLVNSSRFNDATVFGQIAVQHRQPAVLRVGMGLSTNAAAVPIQVQTRPAGVLAECFLGGNAGGSGGIAQPGFVPGGGSGDVPAIQRLAQGFTVDGANLAMQQSGPIQFAQNGDHSTRSMHIFHVVVRGGRRDLAQVRHLPRQPVNVTHGEIHSAFLGGRQQMQHGVGRAAHRNIQADRIFKRGKTGNGPR